MPIVEKSCPVKKITTGPCWHFFGYYDKTTWDRSGRYLLALRVPSIVRHPTPEDAATIGLVDQKDRNRFRPLVQTTAWNWQQGAMVQWLESSSTRQIIYNTRTADGYGSIICDTEAGSERALPLLVYAVSPDGRNALTVNYVRLRWTHPTIGYTESSTAHRPEKAPPDDGIHIELEPRLVHPVQHIIQRTSVTVDRQSRTEGLDCIITFVLGHNRLRFVISDRGAVDVFETILTLF